MDFVGNELLFDTSESSDSSSEDEMRHKRNLILALSCISTKNTRNCIKNFIEQVTNYTETEFITHFRLQRSQVNSLIQRFEDGYQKDHSLGGRKPLSAEHKILIFLWFCGHQTSSYRDVAYRFDVSLSSLCSILNEVSSYLCSIAPEVIVWPTEESQAETAEYYLQNKGLQGVVGLIGNSHIEIDKPIKNIQNYYNRRKFYSIQLQAICNHKKHFIDVCVGCPGSTPEAQVFKMSDVYKKLSSIPNGKYLLGDCAYPCLEHLIIPYHDNGHLTRKQMNFNKILSCCRVEIEHTFDLLKQRFPQLVHIKLKNISLLINVVKACCVLHNLSSEDDLQIMHNTIKEEEIRDIYEEHENIDNGRKIRDNIATLLDNQNFNL